MENFNLTQIKESTLIRHVEFHPVIDSTNNRAKDLFKQPNVEERPFLVLAAEQTAGRGRGSKRWWTGRGSLAMSLGLELSKASQDRSFLTSLSPKVGRIIAELVASRIPDGHRTEARLPNDVYVNGKKIAGILIESPTPQQVIVGIGLNINNRFADAPPELQNLPITTLYDIHRKELDLTEIVIEILQRLIGPPVSKDLPAFPFQ